MGLFFSVFDWIESVHFNVGDKPTVSYWSFHANHCRCPWRPESEDG